MNDTVEMRKSEDSCNYAICNVYAIICNTIRNHYMDVLLSLIWVYFSFDYYIKCVPITIQTLTGIEF
ncbi:hypothetical protein HanXRQr2_Chr16g0750761 [Helianthus annuus]|uniref:Uncharacterized protein n=1 Tax=Helianthus annuus TaxID=4232 RepID=A0A9K3GYV6_HELAN|nr:hypothetical protein HanXRQr2_Chr16g0750761 [Helianthus annuus]